MFTPCSMNIRQFRTEDTRHLIALWQRTGLTRPWNDPAKDILRKLRIQPELFLVGILDSAVVASVMAGYEGHRGWVNYLAVDLQFRRRGYARALMARVEALLVAMGCPKLNTQVRASNPEALEFYRRLGYVSDEAISLGKRIIPDT
jgi:ribosomal protein S18 acetylase RimI-like enzyme